jgi:hypothetical protein
MSRKPYLLLSGTIFLVVAVLHLLRLIAGEPVLIGTTVVPLWISWFGFPGAAALGFWAHALARKEPA